MRRRLVALFLAAAVVAGCSSDTDDVPDAAPTPAEADDTEEPTTDALQAIADLPAVSLRSLDLPDVPEGLDAIDVTTAADTARALALDAFGNRLRWAAGPTSEVQRSHLAIAGPDFAEQVETSEVLGDGAPTAQLFVSVFDPEAQPIAPPRVVGARWDVDEREDEDGSAPFVTLQVHAMYLVGDEDEPQAVLVRRTIGLGGNDLGRVDTQKDWLVETELVGADTCTFYRDGRIAPTEDDPAAEEYEEFLAEAESEELDGDVTQTPDLADLRAQACD